MAERGVKEISRPRHLNENSLESNDEPLHAKGRSCIWGNSCVHYYF